jgi:hypothetical protein
VVKQDGTTPTEIESFEYGSTNARLNAHDHIGNRSTIYASVGGTTLAEYTENTPNNPEWTKTYTYLGDKQLATITPNGSGGEYVEFNHPDSPRAKPLNHLTCDPPQLWVRDVTLEKSLTTARQFCVAR